MEGTPECQDQLKVHWHNSIKHLRVLAGVFGVLLRQRKFLSKHNRKCVQLSADMPRFTSVLKRARGCRETDYVTQFHMESNTLRLRKVFEAVKVSWEGVFLTSFCGLSRSVLICECSLVYFPRFVVSMLKNHIFLPCYTTYDPSANDPFYLGN